MRVIVIGATGTIGKAVVEALADRHEVVRVGRRSGDLQVDIASKESIERFFAEAGPFDALVSAAGDARFSPLASLTDEDFAFSLSNKLMGQVNLVRTGLRHVRDDGSFTLTSPGERGHHPGQRWARGLRARCRARSAARGARQRGQPLLGQRDPGRHGARRLRRSARGHRGPCLRRERRGKPDRRDSRRAGFSLIAAR